MSTENTTPETQAEQTNETETTTETPTQQDANATATQDEVLDRLVNELKEARQQADEAIDQALRAKAELQNFRRRKERESSERVAQANANLLREILPVLDDFERAFANVPASISGEEQVWVEGFRLIERKLHTILERQGVTPIESSGEFDPNLHEAISMEPSDDVPSGEIIAEVQRGYKLNDKVLRPARVRVAQ